MSAKLRNTLKGLVAGICILVLIKLVDFKLLVKLFKELDVSAIIILLAISFVMVLVSAVKWKALIDFLGERIPLGKLYSLYLVSYYTNLLLPSYLGGDVIRSYYAGKSVGQTQAAAATVLERFSGVAAMISIALVSSFFLSSVNWVMRVWIFALSITVVLIAGVALSKRFGTLLRKLPYGNSAPAIRVFNVFDKLAQGFRLVAANKKLLIEIFGLSFVFHALTVVNTLASGYAVGWTNPPILELSMVIPTILIISALPVAPQGLGLQEGAFVFFLTQVGATTEQALSIALILRAKSYVLALSGGVIYHGFGHLFLASNAKKIDKVFE